MTLASDALSYAAERDEQLALMDNARFGLTLLELTTDVAIEAPVVSGVATVLPIARSVYLLRDGAAALRVPAGTLALIPTNTPLRLSAQRRARRRVRSLDHLLQQGHWLLGPVQCLRDPRARLALMNKQQVDRI